MTRPLLLLLFALPVQGQDTAKAPVIDTSASTPYLAVMKLRDAPVGTTRNWYVEPRPPDLRLFPANLDSGGRVVLLSGPPGEYVVTVRIGKPGKPDADVIDDAVTVRVVLGGVVPVPPGPGPGPVPPGPTPVPPVDPLAQSLKAAAAADGFPPARLLSLAAAFANAANQTVAGKTVGELMTAHKGALAGVKLPNRVADALSAELRALDPVLPPANPSKVPTNAELDAVRALLARLSLACSEAAK